MFTIYLSENIWGSFLLRESAHNEYMSRIYMSLWSRGYDMRAYIRTLMSGVRVGRILYICKGLIPPVVDSEDTRSHFQVLRNHFSWWIWTCQRVPLRTPHRCRWSLRHPTLVSRFSSKPSSPRQELTFLEFGWRYSSWRSSTVAWGASETI